VKDTSDGSVVMMKTRDIFGGTNAQSIVEWVHPGSGYNFTGVFDGSVGNSAWMGANEEGLCVVQSWATNLNSGSTGPSNGEINRILLEDCKSVDEVDSLLKNPSGPVAPGYRQADANIGVVDRWGNAAFFEVDKDDHVRCDVTGRFDVRTNWALYHPNRTAGSVGAPRYYRAKSLMENATGIDFKWMCQNLSKDLGPRPYPPVLNAEDQISQYCTVSSAVFVAGRQNYSGRTTSMWTCLGEPSLGLYTPVFPVAGATPVSLDTFYQEIHKKKLYCYSGYTDKTMETVPLLGIQNYSLQIEGVEFGHFGTLMNDLLKNPPVGDAVLRAKLSVYEKDDTDNATYWYKMEQPWPAPPVPEHGVMECIIFMLTAVAVAVSFRRGRRTIRNASR
jgi:hypothetical protein